MKKIILSSALLLIVVLTFGQTSTLITPGYTFYNATSSPYQTFSSGGSYKGYIGVYSSANDLDVGTGTTSTGKLNLVINAVPKMTVDNAGRVGIGTTTPSYPLHVNAPSGGFTMGITSGTANSWFAFNNSSGYIGYLGTFTGATQMDFGTNGSGTDVNIVTNASPKLTVKLNGDVGIGITAPLATLDVVRGTATNGTAMFRGTTNISHFNYYTGEDTYIRGGKSSSKVHIGDTGQSVGLGGLSLGAYSVEVHGFSGYGLGLYSVANTSHWELYVPNSANSNLNLYGNNSYRGTFDGTTGAYTSVSDRTLKTNITSLSSVLGKVMKLEPSTYQFIDNNPTSKTSIGLIAQDVETLFPEFIYKNADRDGKELRTMDYAGLSVVALKAIQEQQVIIEALTARIAALEKK